MANFFNSMEDQFLKDNYLVMTFNDIAKIIGRSKYGVRNRIKKLGLVIPVEVLKQRSIDSHIKKGSVPPNKGKQMPAELRDKISHTWFKGGSLPHNTKHDNDISVRMHKRCGKHYKYIRISQAVWVPYHRYTWEQVYGAVAENHLISFKDGNTMNCNIENLECITMSENMLRNTIQNIPEEIKRTIQILNGFKRKLNRYEKKHQ